MPEGIPALPGITAKILIIVEKVLDVFVNLDSASTSMQANLADCSYMFYNGGTTACGDALVGAIAGLVASVMELGGYFIGALGVVVAP